MKKELLVFSLILTGLLIFGCTQTTPIDEDTFENDINSNQIISDNFCGCNYCIMEANNDYNLILGNDLNDEILNKKCSDYNRIEICAKELEETNTTIRDCIN